LRYNIPATIFLPTALTGTNEWFWPDKLGSLLRTCFTTPNGECISTLYEKWPWTKTDGVKNIAVKIDSIIEAAKVFPDDQIRQFIEEITALFELTFPDERVLLNWDEVGAMSEHGISFGSHSASHAIMTNLAPERIQNEVTASLNTLREKKVNYVPVFCYPNGNYTKEIAEQVKSAGYSAAVTTQFGVEDRSSQELYALKRIGIHNDISKTVPLFNFHISGLNNLL
jgi:peptidoglycan/xylan/chitin deacetylase (PgdA/CDA1 family)